MRYFIDLVESVGSVDAESIKHHIFDTLLAGQHYEHAWNGREWIKGSDSPDLMADEWGIEVTDPEFKTRLWEWVNARYDEVIEKLNDITMRDGGYHVHRCLKVRTDWFASLVKGSPVKLGEYWTFSARDWDINSCWSDPDMDGYDIVVEAVAPPSGVNWTSTIMANMDWYSGDYENELRLIADTRLNVLGICKLDEADDCFNIAGMTFYV